MRADGVQHARQDEISDELPLACQQSAIFAPQQRAADVRVSDVVHWSNPHSRRASLWELPGEVQLRQAGLSVRTARPRSSTFIYERRGDAGESIGTLDFIALAAMWWDTRSENARETAKEKVSHLNAITLIFQRS